MIRAIWKVALLAVVTSAGVALGQTAPHATRAARPADKIVTLQEKGGLPEKCRVLKTWTTDAGHKASLLQTLDSDEMVTVVQTTAARPGSRQVGASIYRWATASRRRKAHPFPRQMGRSTRRRTAARRASRP